MSKIVSAPEDVKSIDYIVWDVGGPIDPLVPEIFEFVKNRIADKIVKYNSDFHPSKHGHDEKEAREAAKNEYNRIYGNTKEARKTVIDLTGQDCFDECMNQATLELEKYVFFNRKMHDFFSKTKEQGIKHYVLTNGPNEYTHEALRLVLGEKYESCFEDIYTIEDVFAVGGLPKPDLSSFKIALDKMDEKEEDRIDPENVLYIGDEDKDMKSVEVGMLAFKYKRPDLRYEKENIHILYDLFSERIEKT